MELQVLFSGVPYTGTLPQGEATYFERLFRDVRVDATLFTLVEDESCP